MWGNQNMNQMNRNDVSVNTNLKTSNSDTSSLNIQAWNQNISLRISPATGVDANGVTQYEKTRRGNASLSMEGAAALLDAFKRIILPTYDQVIKGEIPCPDELSVCVETGRSPKKNLVFLKIKNPSDGSNVPDAYVEIHQAVTDENIADGGNIFTHKFPKRKVFINMNTMTGVGTPTYANSDLNIFLNILGDTNLLLPFSEHVSKYTKERAKLGGGNTQGNTGFNPGFGGNNFNQPSPAYSMFGGTAEEIPFN